MATQSKPAHFLVLSFSKGFFSRFYHLFSIRFRFGARKPDVKQQTLLRSELLLHACDLAFKTFKTFVLNGQPDPPPYIFLNFMFLLFYARIFSMIFFAFLVSSKVNVWHIFKSSYNEVIKKLLISSHELLNVCKSSIIDFTLLCRKHTAKVFMF